ncbi:hypothetical protein B4903_23190, partial [Yersinia frederiksenii]
NVFSLGDKIVSAGAGDLKKYRFNMPLTDSISKFFLLTLISVKHPKHKKYLTITFFSITHYGVDKFSCSY